MDASHLVIRPEEWNRRIDLAAAAILNAFSSPCPKVAAVLGSGFKSFLDRVTDVEDLDLSLLPYFPRPSVKGHGASLVFATVEGKRVLLLTGRVHIYEGYSAQEVVFYVRVLHRIGVESLILTNAAGGVNPQFKAGDTVVISDHVNMTGHHCLIADGGYFGPQFLDMTACYDDEWRTKLVQKYSLQTGVYFGLTGPTYETAAECRMLRGLGADMVGMSTVQEAIAAHHMGMKIGGLSFIANASAGPGEDGGTLTHEEVVLQGKRHSERLADILAYGISCF